MKLSGESANVEFDTGIITIPASGTYPLFLTQAVNMRTILGDMFDKYEKFLIVFNSLGATSTGTGLTYSAGTITGQGNTVTWTLGMFGDLQFISNSVNGQLSNIAYFPTRFTLPVVGSVIANSSCTAGITFAKPKNDVVTLTMAPYLIRGGGAGIAVSPAGNSTTIDVNLNFTVYGLIE